MFPVYNLISYFRINWENEVNLHYTILNLTNLLLLSLTDFRQLEVGDTLTLGIFQI